MKPTEALKIVARSSFRAGTLTIQTALCCAWLIYLFLQEGQSWDESEHAHAAWLISRGERPLDDFFQHHQPLLWNVLALYFRVGLTGPDVLIWGRVIVVLSGLLVFASLSILGREFENARHARLSWFGIVWFIGLTVLLPELFVIRPETIATAAILAALALWCKASSPWAAAAAGVLAGASCYASPRFIIVSGCFFLLGLQTRRRWLCFVIGVVAFIALYTGFSGYSLTKVLFNLRFSAYLQTVGDEPHGISTDYLLNVTTLALLPLLTLLCFSTDGRYLKSIALLGYSVVVILICHLAAGHFTYAQAYAPSVAVVSVTASWIWGHSSAHDRLSAFAVGSTLVGIALGWNLLYPRIPNLDFLSDLHLRNELAAAIPVGEKVLVYTIDSPITVEDASYYGSPIWDAQDRLCRAIHGFKSSYKLPDCDFLEVLESEKPYLVERSIARSMRAEEASRVEAIIHANYAPPELRFVHETHFGELMVRRASSPP